jgi:YD repeat-containing protein
MRRMLFFMAASMLAGLAIAQAQTRTYFDGEGNIVGTEMPSGPKSRFYYGADGGLAGSSMDAGNTRYYYDADGNLAGSSMSSGRRRND